MVDIKPIRSKYHLEVLSADELAAIQSATLQILDQVGVRFPSERALHIFAEHGAQVDTEDHIVRLPQDLVQAALNHALRVYNLNGRSKGTDLLLDGTSSYFGTNGFFLVNSLSGGFLSQSKLLPCIPMNKLYNSLFLPSAIWLQPFPR